MINLTQRETKHYRDLATKHADFLCNKVFKPAFEMAFMHGAKHMKDDMIEAAQTDVKQKGPQISDMMEAIEAAQEGARDPLVIKGGT